mgnify:CR=1 FL=1
MSFGTLSALVKWCCDDDGGDDGAGGGSSLSTSVGRALLALVLFGRRSLLDS